MSGRLTAAFVKSVRHRGGRARADRHHDGGHGLSFQVMPSGSKQWCQRLSLDGKRSDYGLGAYPFMELATLDWVHWYNHRRLFESLGYVPPAEFEAHYDHQLHESAMAA